MNARIHVVVLAVMGLLTAHLGAQDHDPAHHGSKATESDPHAHHRAMASEPAALDVKATSSLTIHDATVRDHHGAAREFRELLPTAGPVAINFIFTTCTTICPPMGATFAKLERMLDDADSESAEHAKLISISVDPAVDTPARLARWAERFGAGERWTLVTGDKREIDRLLKSLRVFTPDKIDHAPIVLLGDTRTGRWLRANALAPPAAMIASLETLAPDSDHSSHPGETP